MCPNQFKAEWHLCALLSPDRFCEIPSFGGKSGVVQGWFFVQKNTSIVTTIAGFGSKRWYASRAIYISSYISLVMVAGNGKTIPKGAKVTNAALRKPKRGNGRNRVRLFISDMKYQRSFDIETRFEEHPTRKVTDPQDKIAKYKDYILHCWKEGKNFEWPMTSIMKIDCNTWQEGLQAGLRKKLT